MSAATTPALICIDCDLDFLVDESPDLDRCAHCAGVHEWREHATEHIDAGPLPATTEA
jgi:hypothetical protein